MEAAFELKNLDRVPACIEVGLQASKRGDLQTARQMFRAALRQFNEHTDVQPHLIELTVRIADTYFNEGRYDRARSWYGRALHFSQRLYGANTVQAACLMTRLAEICVLQSDINNFQKVFENMQRAYLLSREDDTPTLLSLLIDLSWALCLHGHASRALYVNNFIAQIKLKVNDDTYLIAQE